LPSRLEIDFLQIKVDFIYFRLAENRNEKGTIHLKHEAATPQMHRRFHEATRTATERKNSLT